MYCLIDSCFSSQDESEGPTLFVASRTVICTQISEGEDAIRKSFVVLPHWRFQVLWDPLVLRTGELGELDPGV